jgi:transposase-like protein
VAYHESPYLRVAYRAGERDTRAGTIEIAIPNPRSGSYFPTGSRSGAGGPSSADYR